MAAENTLERNAVDMFVPKTALVEEHNIRVVVLREKQTSMSRLTDNCLETE